MVDNSPMPIFITPSNKKEEEEPSEAPKWESVEVPKVDPFVASIAQVLKTVSPAVVQAIKNTECFARTWKDENGVCPEQACQVRSLCKSVYEQVCKAQAAPVSVPMERVEEVKQKNIRLEYLGGDWPIDRYAKILWESFGSPSSPPTLNSAWTYGSAGTKEKRDKSAKEFIEKHGDGLLVCRRNSYHLYFFNGRHLCRLWVNAAKYGWLDLNEELSKEFTACNYNLESATIKDKKAAHQFFNKRVMINSEAAAKEIAGVINRFMEKK
jgi:hypothetical protein